MFSHPKLPLALSLSLFAKGYYIFNIFFFFERKPKY